MKTHKPHYPNLKDVRVTYSEDLDNDHIGMFWVALCGIVVALIVVAFVDKVTGLELHNVIGDAVMSLIEMV